MSKWEIEPEGVMGILGDVQDETEQFGKALTEEKFEEIFNNLELMPASAGGAMRNGLFGSVPAAVSNVYNDQVGAIEAIVNRVTAGLYGVAAATQEYLNADGDMTGAAAAQAQMVIAAESGDLSYFDQYEFDQ